MMIWVSWDQSGINKIPQSPGVYAIIKPFITLNNTTTWTWIYVGRTITRDLNGRVQEHYNGGSNQAGRIHAQTPTLVGYEVIYGDENRKTRETSLIAIHNPICND